MRVLNRRPFPSELFMGKEKHVYPFYQRKHLQDIKHEPSVKKKKKKKFLRTIGEKMSLIYIKRRMFLRIVNADGLKVQ